MVTTRRGPLPRRQAPIMRAATRHKTFRFLDLPPELRNRIYGYVFEPLVKKGNDERWYLSKQSTLNARTKVTTMLALLQACRQVYDEALTIPYHANHLYFRSIQIFATFMTEVGVERTKAIRTVTIELGYGDNIMYGALFGYGANQNNESHRWGMLHFLPSLKDLRFNDAGDRSRFLLANPEHASIRAIKRLKGLSNVEVMVENRTSKAGGVQRTVETRQVEMS